MYLLCGVVFIYPTKNLKILTFAIFKMIITLVERGENQQKCRSHFLLSTTTLHFQFLRNWLYMDESLIKIRISRMYWIFGVTFVDLGDSCAVGGDPAINIVIAWVPVLNPPEYTYT